MQSLSLDHITPRSQQGATNPDNLALACQGCNNHKYTKTQGTDPITGDLVQLFHPRKQRWQDHFAWNADCALMIGLTATGRATIETLHLNRESVVNLRRVLFAVGQHPPPEATQTN